MGRKFEIGSKVTFFNDVDKPIEEQRTGTVVTVPLTSVDGYPIHIQDVLNHWYHVEWENGVMGFEHETSLVLNASLKVGEFGLTMK